MIILAARLVFVLQVRRMHKEKILRSDCEIISDANLGKELAPNQS